MDNEQKTGDILDKFLVGLKRDIETKDVTLGTGIKWILLFVVCYYLFPFVVLAILWVIWKKTDWNSIKKWVITGLTLAVAGWVFSFSSSVPTVNTQQAVTQPVVQNPVVSQTQEKPLEAEPIPIEDKQLYQVVSVTDGDTIKVDLNGTTETLRLIGIDTPETVDPRKPVQCFGEEASKKAKETLTGKKVSLEADPTQGERDKYQRLLRYVYLEDGTSFNKWMIQEGYAHEYTYQSNPYKYQTEFKDAERSARDNKKGLWGNMCNGDTTQSASTPPLSTTTTPVIIPVPVASKSTGDSYSCNCSKTCAQMSCSEAQYQLNTCGCSRRDGDGDGLACDSQCQ